MESFPAVASRVLHEFRALLQHSPSPLGSTRMLQIITINMFTIHYAQIRGKGSTLSVAVDPVWSIENNLSSFSLCCDSFSSWRAGWNSVCVRGADHISWFSYVWSPCATLHCTPKRNTCWWVHNVSLVCCLHRQHKITLSIFLTPMQLCLIVCFPFVSARAYPSRWAGGLWWNGWGGGDGAGVCLPSWPQRAAAKHEGLVRLDARPPRQVEPSSLQYSVSPAHVTFSGLCWFETEL